MIPMELAETASTLTLPPLCVYEPAGRRGMGSDRRPRPLRINESATTLGAKPGIDLRIDDVALEAELWKRMRFLMSEAHADGEPFSAASSHDFLTMLGTLHPQRKPALFRNAKGNLRTIWRNDAFEQIALEFLGNGNIQFVIFKRAEDGKAMSRVAGIAGREAVLKHIRAAGAQSLLAA